MKWSISTKLFLVLVAISIATVAAMGVSARISFTRGFIGYLNEQSGAYADSVVPRLAEAYRTEGSWRFLHHNPRAWYRLLDNRTRRERDSGPPQFSEVEFSAVHLRLTLLDADRNIVIGNRDVPRDASMRAVVVDGRTVGWLALIPYQQATAAADVRFQQRQLTQNWLIGWGTVIVAALAAWWLSRLLVTPLKRITAATHNLASGDYSVRIPVTSKDEIGGLSEDFNRLAQALAHNEQLRRSFMADVSHELRTPLSVLKGELEAIEDGVRAMTPATLASLQSEVTTLNKLVSDLYDLSLSDIGALSYRMAQIEIDDVLHATLAAFQQRLAERELKVQTDIARSVMVNGDEGRLQQLFNNLLENCARYTQAGGVVRVGCRIDNAEVLVEIEDSGPGVPADMLPRIFERFVRAEASRNRSHGGAGLGLAICRNIVEAHGGTITASAAPLGGLLMSIRLPRLREVQV
ncbi:HAMP domain-containing protein [Steroidobacter sp. S1-65]|uniref:histidine kinase n=1 Tax=Steroidobacter gossypii TaxID=2805490 RepID=A0ABS1WUL4_9GAMM|nr:ATP-binding protein [Steroidobacter gossypii]MBM0104648.1 HAMP domain-containing protein [Steroidobacter gossypii]